MSSVICEVTPGLRGSERTVAVKDFQGRKRFLRVEKSYLSESGGKQYLPVGIVGFDEQKQLALIELPHESDSGVSRLWVNRDALESVAGTPIKGYDGQFSVQGPA